jgi:N-acetyl-gamma-glutamyl-phosphate reductase
LSRPVRVGILGAGGFTGQELIRILGRHPYAEIVYITSSEYASKPLAEVFPQLAFGATKKLVFSPHPQQAQDAGALDAIFLATPDEVSLRWAPQFLAQGVKVIDISGAFRLLNKAEFKEYYGLEHDQPAALRQAVYGLSEVNREKIRSASLIANPGCYPTAALLPLYAYRALIDTSRPLIIDAKSGTSGAGGRKEKDSLGYSTVYENFRAYKTEKHQHTPEIVQEFSRMLSGSRVSLKFTPHLLPMYRGILSSTYAFVKPGVSAKHCLDAGQSFAEKEIFVRYRSSVNHVELRSVQHTNFCDYAHHLDEKNGLLQIVSAIDNLMKGAAGQAVQNMNLMFSLPETAGVY